MHHHQLHHLNHHHCKYTFACYLSIDYYKDAYKIHQTNLFAIKLNYKMQLSTGGLARRFRLLRMNCKDRERKREKRYVRVSISFRRII